MAELRDHAVEERTVHEQPVYVSDGERSGGMGLGMALGAILVGIFVIGMLWFAFGGRLGGVTPPTPSTPPVNNNPTINIQPPNIKVPDTITVNPPANNAPAPQQPQGGSSQPGQ